MQPSGANLIGAEPSRRGPATLRARDPQRGQWLEPAFHEASPEELERAARLAAEAAEEVAAATPQRRAAFLRAAGRALLDLGDALLGRAAAETGLPPARLAAECQRTVNQLELFASLVEEGSWVDARIDRARPERQPTPRPDLRRLLVPLGPVAVFGASNFPLAFSVAGGDTASALAAGCPVIVKGHPAHPGTSELAARALIEGLRASGLPAGAVALLQGAAPELGQALAAHPEVKAVAFTGSLAGGRALSEVAARRSEPIPVYAEMGSSNPFFVLPGALRERGQAVAQTLAASVTLGAGQFCTNPGLGFVLASPQADAFVETLGAALCGTPPGTFVHAGIRSAYETRLEELAAVAGVHLTARAQGAAAQPDTGAHAALYVTDAATFARHAALQGEVYGPAHLLVRCASADELLAAARSLPGQLSATLHATPADLAEHAGLVALLGRKVGRLVLNGVPTGVEVAAAMHHGGPYPASSDVRSTSVGSAAILRFVRPLCYQDFPQAALPLELRDDNPRGLLRLVDGRYTREAL